MYSFFAIYSLMLIVAAYFLIPYLRETSVLASHIVSITFVLMNAFMFGAVTGFTLLDDQDDKVLLSLKITPISVKDYVSIKLFISYLFGLIATILMVFVTKLNDIAPLFDIILILLLVPIQGPIVALFINCFSNNKVEGFVIMKFTGIILIVPIAALFLTNWTEVFLGVLPGFWPARMLSMHLIPGNYLLNHVWIYFLLGLFVNLASLVILFKLYKYRIKI